MPATDLAVLTETVREAGRIASGFAAGACRQWEKPDGSGLVTEADLAVDGFLREALCGERPGYGWLSEETQDTPERLSCASVFIVDPIDGTRSFAEGSQTWAISAAIADGGVVTAGAVFLPVRDLLYTAARGLGAWLNGEPLVASARTDLTDAEVLGARPILAPEHWPEGVPRFARAHRPSLAYRLGLVGQGRFDAMLTFRPTWEWDVAAGSLIVEEARGTCSDRRGGSLRFNNALPQLDGLVAAGRGLHPVLMRALGQGGAAPLDPAE